MEPLVQGMLPDADLEMKHLMMTSYTAQDLDIHQ
jgi:hypothetical protein